MVALCFNPTAPAVMITPPPSLWNTFNIRFSGKPSQNVGEKLLTFSHHPKEKTFYNCREVNKTNCISHDYKNIT